MKYMLDTNICSYIIKNKPLEVLEKFREIDINKICISVITYAELQYWVARNYRLHLKSKNTDQPKINQQIIDDFVSHLNIVEFNSYAAEIYAKLREESQNSGIIVGDADLMIGAHAISLNSTLVTNNIKDFQSLANIKLENWAEI